MEVKLDFRECRPSSLSAAFSSLSATLSDFTLSSAEKAIAARSEEKG
jgi:hypothetical protein